MNRPLAKDDLPDQPAVTASPAEAAGMTPMMAQYHAIKSDHPDALLFYRMGDFYELFFDDAVKASAALSIALTTRGNHLGTPIPMCGVPVHAADEYLRRLISAGHRVAVCEQTEDPAEARKRGSKSVVQREVVRLVTPGTLTEETLLEPGRANYLMAISALKSSGNSARNDESDHGCFGLAWIDISTGAFMVCQSDRQNLAATVARIDPSEVIVAEHVFQDPALAAIFGSSGGPAVIQPRAFFESSTAEGRLTRFFNVASLDGFGEFTRAEIAASAAILSYVEKTQFAERPPLARPVRQSEAERMIIDAASRANLELFRTLSGETSGTLFKAIDRTVTGPGSRLLAERLASPLLDVAVIDERLETISFFLTETRLSENLRDRLRHLPDAVRALSRIALNRGGPRDLGVIQKALQSGRAIRAELGKFPLPAELGNARTALDGLPDSLADELGLALSSDLPMFCRDGGFIEAGYRTALDEARQLRDESRRVVASLQSRYGQETGVRSLKIKHNAVLGYFIEVTQANSAALTETAEAKAQFIHRQTMANAMRFTTTELAELEGRIKGAGESALALEIGLFDELAEAIVAETTTIKRAAEALSVLDVSLGLAVLAEEQGYCRPAVDESLDFRIVGGRHPVVEQMLRRDASEPFIANDCDLSPGSDTGNAGAIWLLTGPNMGGKSTFLRQNALIAILAQAGSFVPAGSARIGIVDRLFSRVGASDDLAHGRSTFMVEMIETASILNQAGRRSLIILDEIGRGTATFDGLSIAWATVEHLHGKNNSRAIFATHFHELTALCEHLERLAKVTMRVKEWKGEVVFLHEVMPGAADRSYGIQVARLAGLPEAVVERARDVLERLENQNTSGPSGGLLSDLPLFSIPAKGHAPSSVETAPETPDPLAEALAALDPDDLTPREALEALYALKKVRSNDA